MTDDAVLERLLDADASLFVGDTARHALGWLGHPVRYGRELARWADVIPRRHRHTVWIGIGGSSSPARALSDGVDNCPLTVLDTTHPDSIQGQRFDNVNVVVASKSGTTLEIQVVLAWALGHGLDPRDLAVITDEGNSLGELADSLGAVRIDGDPNTGGRFSALSPFGLVAALYLGREPGALREELEAALPTPALASRAADLASRALESGAISLPGDPLLSGSALWLDQLVAESTGKDGRGIFCSPGEPQRFNLVDMMTWELATALLARGLDVDPFNQPNVESSKREVMSILRKGIGDDWGGDHLAEWPDGLAGSSALHLQAYAPLTSSDAVAGLRRSLEGASPFVTANLGPRFLHSTGQFHKGGPAGQVMLQIRQRPQCAPERIPGRAFSMHDVHAAQFLGDERALQSAGRTVMTVTVDHIEEVAHRLGAFPLR